MVSLVDIPVSLNTEQFYKTLMIRPDTERAGDFEELAGKVQEIGKPKALYKVSFVDEKGDDSVTIDGVRFTSLTLRKNLDAVERVFPYIATCGSEVDNIEIAQGDFQKKSWIALLKHNLLIISIQYLVEHLNTRYKVPKLSSMNPGSGDATVWPIEQQGLLFSLFDDVENYIGVKITKSLVIVPDMSAAGILFPTEVDFASCQLCHREKCIGRRAPFDKELWESLNQEDNPQD